MTLQNHPDALKPWRLAPLAWLLLTLGTGVLVYGLSSIDLYASLPAYRFRDLLWLALGALMIAGPLRLLPNISWRLAWLLALVAIHLAGLGLGPALCVLTLAISAWCLGTATLGAGTEASLASRILIGLAILAAIVAWLLPYPVHDRLSYLILLGLPIVWQRQALMQQWAAYQSQLRTNASEASGWSLSLLAFVLAMVASAAWLPVLMSDDIVYHLALPTQLIESGYYHFNVDDQVWAVAPWANDILHAIVMMLSGQTEIGALNALWLLLGATLLWRVLRQLDCNRHWAALGTALFFSLPLFHMSTNSMQTELPSTAVSLALLERILLPVNRQDRRGIILMAILASFLLALKISNVAVLLPLLCWWIVRHRPTQLKPWLIGVLIGIAIGGSSFVYAWVLTGNPVLPLFNSLFQSPLMPPTNFSNATYHGLLSWDVLYQATFDSSRFMESEDGTFGYQWLAGCGLLLLGLIERPLRPLLICGLSAVLILFVQMQYLRYLLPALSLLAVVLTVLLARLRPTVLCQVLVVALCLTNLYFQCQSAPPLRAGTVTEILRHGLGDYRERLLRASAPERLLLRSWQTRLGPHASVFAGTNPYTAELAGRGHSVSWYAADFWNRMPMLEADLSGQSYLDYFAELGIDHILIRPEFASPALVAAIAQRAELLDTEGAAMLYRLHWPSRDLTDQPSIVLPDRAGLIQRYDVNPDQPMIGAAQVRLRCAKKGWGVAVNHVARGAFGERSVAAQVSFCGSGHELAFDTSAALPAGTIEWEVQVRTYTSDNPLEILEAKAWMRPDAARLRDRSRTLRLF